MEAEYLKVARNIYLHERMAADLKVCEKRPAVAWLQLSPIIFYFQRLTATLLLVLCKSTRLDPCRHGPFNVVPGGPPCPARHLAVTRFRPLSLERLGRVGGEGHQLAHCPVYIRVNWRRTPEQCSFSSQMVISYHDRKDLQMWSRWCLYLPAFHAGDEPGVFRITSNWLLDYNHTTP